MLKYEGRKVLIVRGSIIFIFEKSIPDISATPISFSRNPRPFPYGTPL
jgi:hypothetical protein